MIRTLLFCAIAFAAVNALSCYELTPATTFALGTSGTSTAGAVACITSVMMTNMYTKAGVTSLPSGAVLGECAENIEGKDFLFACATDDCNNHATFPCCDEDSDCTGADETCTVEKHLCEAPAPDPTPTPEGAQFLAVNIGLAMICGFLAF